MNAMTETLLFKQGERELVSFATHPSKYRHWTLKVEGDVARLVLDIDETSLDNWGQMAQNDFGYIVNGDCTAAPGTACGARATCLGLRPCGSSFHPLPHLPGLACRHPQALFFRSMRPCRAAVRRRGRLWLQDFLHTDEQATELPRKHLAPLIPLARAARAVPAAGLAACRPGARGRCRRPCRTYCT